MLLPYDRVREMGGELYSVAVGNFGDRSITDEIEAFIAGRRDHIEDSIPDFEPEPFLRGCSGTDRRKGIGPRGRAFLAARRRRVS